MFSLGLVHNQGGWQVVRILEGRIVSLRDG